MRTNTIRGAGAFGRWGLAAVAIALCVALPSVASGQATGNASGGETPGAIRVVVFGPPDHLPIQGVEVHVDGHPSGMTNADGAVEIGVAPGVHRVRLVAPALGTASADEVSVRSRSTTEVVAVVSQSGEASFDIEAPRRSARKNDGKPGRASTGEPREQGAPNALLRGVVRSRESGEPVEGARVIVRGVQAEAITGPEGRFELEVPPGDRDLSVIHSEFSTASRQGVEVEAEGATELTFSLAPAAVRMASQTVTIPRIEGGTVELTRQKRESAAATSVIGSEQFAKSGDSTAAGALKRVTGLTVVGGKYVYVRGLGSRYSSTLLNGSTLPSPEPSKRVVPLDLFPTSILESVTVQKTYTPDMPGNFGGGVVDMETRSYPDEFTFGAGLSLSGDTQTTFREGLTYEGGGTDWLGTGDGTRGLPGSLKEATDGKAISKEDRFGRGNFTANELESLGESLPNNWNMEQRTVAPNVGASLQLGDRFDLRGTTVGFRVAGSYDYSRDTDRYTKKTYVQGGSGLREQNSFDFYETTDEIVTSAIFSGGAKFPGGDELQLTSLLNRVSDDHTRRYEGFYSDHGGDIRVTRLQWLERQMMFHQLKGEHEIGSFYDLGLDWRYVYSQARRNEPDRRQYRYDYEQQVDEFVLSDRPESNSRLWSDLVDHNHDAGVSAELPFDVWRDLEASAEIGVDGMLKTRNVNTRRFKFVASETDYDVFSRRPEQVFAEENIGSESFFELREVTRATDNYEGRQSVLAGYAMSEIPVVESLRVNGGARLEYSDQRVETFALFSDDQTVGRLQTVDVLPALNATWEFAERMQLRGAVSRTVNRPNFRELSNARFSNIVGGREFQGNPDLKRATMTHVDTRWEWYPGRGESVSVGAFYKDFTNPIELTFEPGATPLVQPTNVEGARNLGVEFQARTDFDIIDESLRDMYAAGNVSLISSRVQIDPDSEKAELLTTTERPLQGQSPYVLNAQLGYDNVDSETTVAALYHVFGPRIAEVGIYEIPNVVEQPFHSLGLTFAQTFDNGLEFTAEANNLLNLPRRYTQGGRVTHLEYEGRSLSVGISYDY